MSALQKILFPVDFSERCAGAARYVEALAGRFQAEILLLHAVDRGDRAPRESPSPVAKAVRHSLYSPADSPFWAMKRVALGEADSCNEMIFTRQSIYVPLERQEHTVRKQKKLLHE
jgi:nucleotide-binding universal stress UspA family protein